ncbi:hypothetical protein HMF8227_01459 [Saliniradius amylolyticus]|uniref:Uncharacterized protein n=1 Tax=Saliniradius amylolyticus TaxID=2183582 RepID=A0A2S2E2R8_9ALTE|nr:hypothetical protein [Saliniradius amylolyticus]AWL11934.1 hypothetical protein HMF8227_01459 [Saliniradius amylolyticus]
MSNYYAQLNAENIVVGVSQLSGEVDNPALVPVPEYDSALVGQQYDPATGEFSPAPANEPEPIRVISIGSFRRRLSLTEKVAIEDSADSTVKVLEKDLMSSSFVDLDFPATVDGLAYLEQVGILATGRADELRADGTPDEQPKQ